MKNIIITFALLGIFSCKKKQSLIKYSNNYIQYVNPMVGTKNMGHTFPGATAPFGMVQLSPETNQQSMFKEGKYNKKTYEYCSGYQYNDNTIFGFSHTHFSGTGHSDLGDFLVMPTMGKLTLEPGTVDKPGSGYYSYFSHREEKAEPGYYSVKLKDFDINVELTATERVGFHKYTFNQSGEAHIILDLISNIYHHKDKNIWTFVRVENDSIVTGYRQTNGWARTKKVFFAMKFSKPFYNYGHKRYEKITYNGFYRRFDEQRNFPEIAGKNIRAYFDFKTQKNDVLKIKFALSAVSTNGAIKNLQTEIDHWNFEKVKKQTQKKWNKELSKIHVDMQTIEQKETFYSALYHTMLSPIIYEDVDGLYRSLDQNIYTSKDFTNYTIFSLWDTYRALHPLFNILHPTRNNDIIKSMLAHHDKSVHKALPIWSHYANENWCMIGYHSVSVIADAIVKGTTNINAKRVLHACINSATLSYYDGIGDYIKRGYVPEDKNSYSVSKTLEYAYDDWCIAQIAKKAKNDSIYKLFLNRSKNYKNVYHKQSGYMRPKFSDGQWKKEFDPLDTHGQGFIEGNAWNYGLYVPHEVIDMIQMMGGKDKFSKHLDRIFNTPIEDKYISKNEDITRDGIIGNYVHGNEPGHHIPYLYNWTNHPWKTQERVRMIMNEMYSNKEDGLCGNDDAGQMSAWYVFSALGFYPVLPGSNEYAIGSPLVKSANIRLHNGKMLYIKTMNQSQKNVYVHKITINKKELTENTLHYNDIKNGGELVFYLQPLPDNLIENTNKK